MSKKMLWITFSLLVVFSLVLTACGQQQTPAAEQPAAEQPAEQPAATNPPAEQPAVVKPELSITWFAWPPCDALAQLVQDYPDATVKVNCVPYAQWHDSIFTDFAAKGGVDVPIMDSQWTGEAVKGGHVLDMSEFIKNETAMDDFVPLALKAYGEYPADSGVYYGVPIMADVQEMAINKKIFAEYGIDPNSLKTWDDLLKAAQTIKADGKYDGFVWFWIGSGDQIQTAYNQLAWSWGGELWDSSTYKFQGVANSPENVAALEYASELYKTGPEGAGNFSYGEVSDAMCNGKAAMTSIWVGVMSGWTDPKNCAAAADLVFAVPPAGPKAHVLSLGGMGISVSAYTKNQDAAFAFLKWLESNETQTKWVTMGGYSALNSVLASDAFKNTAPFNPVFAEAYPLVKDFYNLPEYYALMTKQGEYLNLAVTGQMTPQEALDKLAEEQQAIIDQAYPGGPPK